MTNDPGVQFCPLLAKGIAEGCLRNHREEITVRRVYLCSYCHTLFVWQIRIICPC
jgi:hypothetical protein